MDKDAQAHFAERPGQGHQMTPQIGKASQGDRTNKGHRRRTGRASDAARRCIAGAAGSAPDADRAGGASGADNRNLS